MINKIKGFFSDRQGQHRLPVNCLCNLIYDQPGRQLQFQWNASYGKGIKKLIELCFRQERPKVELELQIPSL